MDNDDKTININRITVSVMKTFWEKFGIEYNDNFEHNSHKPKLHIYVARWNNNDTSTVANISYNLSHYIVHIVICVNAIASILYSYVVILMWKTFLKHWAIWDLENNFLRTKQGI